MYTLFKTVRSLIQVILSIQKLKNSNMLYRMFPVLTNKY